METIAIGPFNITISIFIWVLSALAGIGVHRVSVRGREQAQILASLLTNSLLIWLLCWKLSSFIFDPSILWKEPLALLYFHGGGRGAWLASALTIVYLYTAGRKNSITKETMLDSVLVFLLGGYSARTLLLLIWGDGNRLTLGLLVFLGLAVLFRWMYRKMQGSAMTAIQLILIFAIGHVFISTLGSNLWEKAEAAATSSTVGLKIGQKAPDFELTDRKGQLFKLSDYRDQTVVLNFWATWCPPCRTEMPEMQKFYEHISDNNVIILAVNATNSETSISSVGDWLGEKRYTFPVLFDSKGDLTQTYRIAAFPSTYVIQPGGLIRLKHQGPMNEAMLKEAVR
ncbi:redoxin domain-containing protein [Paenibacillus sp. GP183]|uniref:redoxin domain-containing protein n=1 Tax=Paenibacillus sp. GP183 TaxID=1882751 RepID=UPI0008969044|nr:redoxin domain-containing protein [Paenibacillus sp. GP183]SEB53343.1 Peroxiredoxin [Paenibacillus sp. GP183]